MKKSILILCLFALFFIFGIGISFYFLSGDSITIYRDKENGEYIYDIKSMSSSSEVYSKVRLKKNKDRKMYVINHKYLLCKDNNIKKVIRLENSKIMLRHEKYDNIYPLNSSSDVVALKKSDKYYLYNLNDEEYLEDFVFDDIMIDNQNSINSSLDLSSSLFSQYIIPVKDGKKGLLNIETLSLDLEIMYDCIYIDDRYYIVGENGKDKLFDSQNLQFVDKILYDEIYDVVDNQYVVLRDNDRIKIIDVDNRLIYDMDDYYSYTYSNTYKENDILSIVFYDDENKLEIDYIYSLIDNTFNKETSEDTRHPIAPLAKKPILYLYPKKRQNVSVLFDHSDILLTTYPKYDNGWNVIAYPDGSLYDLNGKYYYALYWDEIRTHSVDFSSGFYVEGKDAMSFLEDKLTYIGLNDKERNEFIMYWLPILEKNDKNLIYFELTDERNLFSKIHIVPEPDSLLRIMMHVKKADSVVNIKEEKLVPFDRKGFVAVEWGGTEY